ncbi:hypothetical protein EMIHUDRAFT_103547 [Emiliania huxleyi CCMP1516]|uniref:Uncharacterized protein n=2 Tax=Emiliania huxleyi TaxID=2903 RepID=A0A0D3IS42_EMIH1|nr:hypothetical protein EMIHUDRAFT_103547 [Emiliania huxleyi CCMP1516]EOD14077.1 hypothetical protein EMIHUDRAFT_103547 [Emiliania huxleyi CCMP1516]|eukprot:XP_005766506.1 hypothetical protein EMIHUDRAFT_103547 [Emiliania huxleyi CCMP1516]
MAGVVNLTVCSAGGAGRGSTWSPWMSLSSVAFEKQDPDRWFAELELSGVPGAPFHGAPMLPVTHQSAIFGHSSVKQNAHNRERGVCDLWYDPGTTLVALNKVDAALKLAALSSHRGSHSRLKVHGADYSVQRGGVDATGRQRRAVAELASWVWNRCLRRSAMARERYRSALNTSNRALSELLSRAAAGPFPLDRETGRTARSPAFQYAHALGRGACVGECARQEVAACLWLFEFLDPFLIARGRALGLRSLQLLQSPHAGWAVEILDLASADRLATEAEREPGALLERLRGADGEVAMCGGGCERGHADTPPPLLAAVEYVRFASGNGMERKAGRAYRSVLDLVVATCKAALVGAMNERRAT